MTPSEYNYNAALEIASSYLQHDSRCSCDECECPRLTNLILAQWLEAKIETFKTVAYCFNHNPDGLGIFISTEIIRLETERQANITMTRKGKKAL